MVHEPHRSPMGAGGTAHSVDAFWSRQARSSGAKCAGCVERDPLDLAYGRPMARIAGPLPTVPDLPSPVPTMATRRGIRADPDRVGRRPARTRTDRSDGGLHRWHLCEGKKRGRDVGKTKSGKGSKIMALADGSGFPLAVHVASASPHESTLVDATLDAAWTEHLPERLIADRAYDSDPLDERLDAERGVDLIAPHRSNRRRPPTQDGRPLRRYRRRWKIERLFAWLHNFRRLVVRYEYHPENFLAMVQLGCIIILLRGF